MRENLIFTSACARPPVQTLRERQGRLCKGGEGRIHDVQLALYLGKKITSSTRGSQWGCSEKNLEVSIVWLTTKKLWKYNFNALLFAWSRFCLRFSTNTVLDWSNLRGKNVCNILRRASRKLQSGFIDGCVFENSCRLLQQSTGKALWLF